MKFSTVKAVRIALEAQGGWLETIRDELPEYAPHFSTDELGWENGIWDKQELLSWASLHLDNPKA